jgi:hypothetical protein
MGRPLNANRACSGRRARYLRRAWRRGIRWGSTLENVRGRINQGPQQRLDCGFAAGPECRVHSVAYLVVVEAEHVRDVRAEPGKVLGVQRTVEPGGQLGDRGRFGSASGQFAPEPVRQGRFRVGAGVWSWPLQEVGDGQGLLARRQLGVGVESCGVRRVTVTSILRRFESSRIGPSVGAPRE